MNALVELRLSDHETIPLPPGEWRVMWKDVVDLCTRTARGCEGANSGRGLVLKNLDPKSPIYAIAVRYTTAVGENWSDSGCYDKDFLMGRKWTGLIRKREKYFDAHDTRLNSIENKCSFGADVGLPKHSTDRWWRMIGEGVDLIQDPVGDSTQFEILLQSENKRRFHLNIWLTKDNGAQVVPETLLMQWKSLFVELAANGLFHRKPTADNSILTLQFLDLVDAKKLLTNEGVDNENDIQLISQLNVMQEELDNKPGDVETRSSDWYALSEKIVAIQALLSISPERLRDLNEKIQTISIGQGSRDSASDLEILSANIGSTQHSFQQINVQVDVERDTPGAITVDPIFLTGVENPADSVGSLQNSVSEPDISAAKAKEQLERERLAAQAIAQEKEREGVLAEQALAAAKAKEQLERERLTAHASQNSNLASTQNDFASLMAQLQRMQEELKRLKAGSVDQEVLKPVKRETIVAPRYGLVFGNAKYEFVSPLDNSVTDAKSFAAQLKDLGFKVSLHLDLGERDFNGAVRQFKEQLVGGEEVVFYYAGHGVQLASTNYLLPTDVGGESVDQVKDEAIDLQRVLDSLSEKETKFTLAVVDACRDNPFKGRGRAVAGRGLAPTSAATGQMIIFSAGAGQQALDKLGVNDNEPNGLFTRVFLKEMKKPGVSVDAMIRRVRKEVVRLAKSVGHEQVPALYDQTVGEFYFNLN